MKSNVELLLPASIPQASIGHLLRMTHELDLAVMNRKLSLGYKGL